MAIEITRSATSEAIDSALEYVMKLATSEIQRNQNIADRKAWRDEQRAYDKKQAKERRAEAITDSLFKLQFQELDRTLNQRNQLEETYVALTDDINGLDDMFKTSGLQGMVDNLYQQDFKNNEEFATAIKTEISGMQEENTKMKNILNSIDMASTWIKSGAEPGFSGDVDFYEKEDVSFEAYLEGPGKSIKDEAALKALDKYFTKTQTVIPAHIEELNMKVLNKKGKEVNFESAQGTLDANKKKSFVQDVNANFLNRHNRVMLSSGASQLSTLEEIRSDDSKSDEQRNTADIDYRNIIKDIGVKFISLQKGFSVDPATVDYDIARAAFDVWKNRWTVIKEAIDGRGKIDIIPISDVLNKTVEDLGTYEEDDRDAKALIRYFNDLWGIPLDDSRYIEQIAKNFKGLGLTINDIEYNINGERGTNIGSSLKIVPK